MKIERQNQQQSTARKAEVLRFCYTLDSPEERLESQCWGWGDGSGVKHLLCKPEYQSSNPRTVKSPDGQGKGDGEGESAKGAG